jgi:two-component system sensor kinase FixL
MNQPIRDDHEARELDRALLDFMLEYSSDAISIIALDGTILAYSKVAEALFGYTAEEMVGKNLSSVFPLFTAPDLIEAEIQIIARAAAGEEITPYESIRTRRDGSAFHILVSTRAIRDSRGRIIAVARVVRDISERKAHEQDKAFLSQLVNSSADAIVGYALDGTLTSWNPGAERIYGYTAGEMIGKGFDERVGKFTTPDKFGEERSVMERAAAGEYVPPYEAVRTRKDGSLVTVLVSVSPIRNSRGDIIGVARIMRDISERKAHEQDKALLGLIVNSSSDAIISYALDGTITSWNPAAERIYGHTAAEMIGTTLKARLGEFVSPETIAEELKITEWCAAGANIQPFEAVRTRKDGRLVNVFVSVSPIHDANGAVVGVARTVRDISDRKTHEEQKALLGAIVESSNDAIYTKTLEGTITSWNSAAEELFGYAVGEIMGRSVLTLFTPDKIPEEAEIVAKIRAGETIRHYETARVRKNGTRIDVSVTVSPLRGPRGEIVGVSNTVRDITERKAYEARLKSMQDDLIHVGRLNELGQVSAGIAHELNQPLTAMLNYSNIAKRLIAKNEPESCARAFEAVSKAADQAVRAAEIIRRMRSFVEKRGSNRTIEEINAVVKDTMALGFMGADAVNVTTRLELAPGLPSVLVDRVQIQQVLVNLLHNAVDAMADAKTRELTVTTKSADAGVEISVADTGPGIPKEFIGRLFMPFFTTKPGGMGIGLVISQSIVQAHGGKLSVEPNRGGGTVFRFTLPAGLAAG